MELPSCHCSDIRRRGGRPTRRKLGSTSLRRLGCLWPCRIHQVGKQVGRLQRKRTRKPRNFRPTGSGLWGSRERRDRRGWLKAYASCEGIGYTARGLSGVVEGDMSTQNISRKLGTTRGSPRRSRTAKASRISRRAVKSRCACEWGGWGRLSVDGAGQHNPCWSEGPWGRVALATRVVVHYRVWGFDTERRAPRDCRMHEGWTQTRLREGHAGSRLNRSDVGEGPI